MAEIPQSKKSKEPFRGSEWFYQSGESVCGPVSFSMLVQLRAKGELEEEAEVWKAGVEERRRAADVLGPFSKQGADSVLGSGQGVGSILDGPPGGLYLPHLTSANQGVFLFLLLAGIGLIFGAIRIETEEMRVVLMALAAFTVVALMVMALIYLHRAWTMMEMLGGRIKGSRVVSLMLVPFFNVVWSYTVVSGWASLWNRGVRTHPGLSRAKNVWQPLFYFFPVFFLGSQVFLVFHLLERTWPRDPTSVIDLVAMICHGGTVVLGAICWLQIAQAINFLATKKS